MPVPMTTSPRFGRNMRPATRCTLRWTRRATGSTPRTRTFSRRPSRVRRKGWLTISADASGSPSGPRATPASWRTTWAASRGKRARPAAHEDVADVVPQRQRHRSPSEEPTERVDDVETRAVPRRDRPGDDAHQERHRHALGRDAGGHVKAPERTQKRAAGRLARAVEGAQDDPGRRRPEDAAHEPLEGRLGEEHGEDRAAAEAQALEHRDLREPFAHAH